MKTLTPEQAELVARIRATPLGKMHAKRVANGPAPRGRAEQAARWAIEHGKSLGAASRAWGVSKAAVWQWRNRIEGGGAR